MGRRLRHRCVSAVPTDAFDAVGGLDERWFYGPEDVDFCLRLREGGARIVQCGDASCRHPPRRRNRKILTMRGLRHAYRGSWIPLASPALPTAFAPVSSVDVVIVAFQSRDRLDGLVRALCDAPTIGRVVVVDHGSDGSAEVAAGAGAFVIRNPSNPGFGGQNHGLAATDSGLRARAQPRPGVPG